jgi:putative PIN family toxin of toxin-antitoxin system
VTRVVLDTNVLASGFASDASITKNLIDRWQSGEFVLVISEHLLAELERTFEDAYYRLRMSVPRAERAFGLLRNDALMVDLSTPVVGGATHPEDDLVLATALSGEAAVLCTRDKQLLRLRSYQIVAILSPGMLLALLESGSLA